MLSPKARTYARLLKASILGLICLTVILICGGGIYQQVSLRRDRHLNPMPGRRIDVGGYRMHLYCVGSGSPAVILESGLGDTWLAWYKVQPEIAEFTRVCSYDRAGMGWSDSSPKSRSATAIAEEFHHLLQNAGVPPPYILVGHSLGGIYVRMFATLYHSDTAALVLLDSVTPYQDNLLPSWLAKYNEKYLREQTLKQDTMFLGLPRLMGWCGNGPAAIRNALRTVDCRISPWKEHLAEYDAREQSSEQVAKASPLGDLPLVVISEDPDKPIAAPGAGLPLTMAREFSEHWNLLQKGLTHISDDSCRIIAKGSGHNIQDEKPDLVTGVVRELVQQVRAPVTGRFAKVSTELRRFNCVF